MGLPVRIFFENLALVAEARSGDFTNKAKKEILPVKNTNLA